MTPTWRTVAHDHGPRGEECVRAICVEYPAVERLTQRPSEDDPWVTTYCIAGLPQHFHVAEAAIEAAGGENTDV